MVDYQGNQKKDKAPTEAPDKKIEKVVTGEVIVKKKSLGQKFKGLFVTADFGSVIRYVGSDVLLPAARNMIVDASTKGIERMMFGESSAHRRRPNSGFGPKYTYNTPVSRGHREEPRGLGPVRTSRQSRDDFILSSREEADAVLDRMIDILDSYEVVSVGDLNELVGQASNHVDNKWGWVDLRGSEVRQVREGFLLDLPAAEPI